jgi:hypothetical protein
VAFFAGWEAVLLAAALAPAFTAAFAGALGGVKAALLSEGEADFGDFRAGMNHLLATKKQKKTGAVTGRAYGRGVNGNLAGKMGGRSFGMQSLRLVGRS